MKSRRALFFITGFFVVSRFVALESSNSPVLQIGLATAGITGVLALAIWLDRTPLRCVINFIGRYSLEIFVVHTMMSAATRILLQDVVRAVPVSDDVIMYAARLVSATRPDSALAIDFVKKYVVYGASPRAGQSLILAAKARSILEGRYHVDFDDVKRLAHPVLRHRLVLNFHGRADAIDSDRVIDRLLAEVPQE